MSVAAHLRPPRPQARAWGGTSGPRRRRKVTEAVIERAIAVAAASSVVAIVLILFFVAREALPALLGQGGRERAAELFLPSGAGGRHVWQPVGAHAKFDVVPLLVGSLKVTTIALSVSVPVALAAALFVSDVCTARTRRLLKPAIELLAGVPSVVLGVVALTFFGPWLQRALGITYASNALVAGVTLSVAVAPIVFSVSEDAFSAVPRDLREAAYALGARRFQTALMVVAPAAAPGVAAAVALGAGRAIGETMIVLLTSGNAAVLDASPTSGARTITATVAAELGEVERGGEHWRILFLLGLALVLGTFVLDAAGRRFARRLARRRSAAIAADEVVP